MSGMIDIFMDQILRSLNLEREEIEPMVKELAQKVSEFDNKLDTIIANQNVILTRLENGPERNEPGNEPGNGNELGSGGQ